MQQSLRSAVLALALCVAGGAVRAQDPTKALAGPPAPAPAAAATVPRWVSLAPARCIIVLRDASPDWRSMVEMVRHRSGSVSFIVRVREPLLVQPEVGQRVRLAWGTSAFGERGWTVSIRRVVPPTEGRSLALLMVATASQSLTEMIERAGRSSYLLVGLPGDLPPYRLSSSNFREAWQTLDACGAPEAPAG